MLAFGRYEQPILRITQGLLLLALATPLVYSWGFVFPFTTLLIVRGFMLGW